MELKEKTDTLRNEIVEKYKEIGAETEEAKRSAKSVTPLTKEQRLKLAEFNSKIQREDRRYAKLGLAVKQAEEMAEEQAHDHAVCKAIMDHLKPQPLREMLNQTRKLDKFAAIEKAAARNQGKLESTSKEAELIHADLLEMNESIAEYVSGF